MCWRIAILGLAPTSFAALGPHVFFVQLSRLCVFQLLLLFVVGSSQPNNYIFQLPRIANNILHAKCLEAEHLAIGCNRIPRTSK